MKTQKHPDRYFQIKSEQQKLRARRDHLANQGKHDRAREVQEQITELQQERDQMEVPPNTTEDLYDKFQEGNQ